MKISIFCQGGELCAQAGLCALSWFCFVFCFVRALCAGGEGIRKQKFDYGCVCVGSCNNSHVGSHGAFISC